MTAVMTAAVAVHRNFLIVDPPRFILGFFSGLQTDQDDQRSDQTDCGHGAGNDDADHGAGQPL